MIANILHNEGRERLPERQEGLGPYCRRLRGERTLTAVAKRAGLQVSSLKRIEDGDTKRLKSRTLAGGIDNLTGQSNKIALLSKLVWRSTI